MVRDSTQKATNKKCLAYSWFYLKTKVQVNMLSISKNTTISFSSSQAWWHIMEAEAGGAL